MAISGTHSWIENSDVLSLFPTLVWKIQLRAEVHEPIDASALGLLRSLRQGLPELKTGEVWQSGHALHWREELHELCDCVSRAAASVLQFLNIGERAIEITGCWANLYAPGAAHRAHSHPNNYLSGCTTCAPGPAPTASTSTTRAARLASSGPRSRNSLPPTLIRSWCGLATVRYWFSQRICITPSMPTPAARAA